MSEAWLESFAERLDDEYATAVSVVAAPPEDGWPCCAHGCTRRAAYAIRFHNQAGHVHDCSPCTAQLREWNDVAEVVPLPCPFPHGDGSTWTDQPREL